MARSYANIFTAIWQEPDWRNLPADAQRTYMLLVTQPNISAAGMLPLTVRRWASMAEDTKPDDIRGGLDRLTSARFIAVDDDTEELLVRSFVRHDNGYRNSKRMPAIRDAAGDISSRPLRRVLAGELARLGLPSDWTGEAPDSPSDSPSEADPRPPASPPVGKPVDNHFPQVDSPSDSPSDGISGSERVVVTTGTYVEAPSHKPQTADPTPSPPSAPRPGDGAVLDAEIVDDTPNLPAVQTEPENAGQITKQWIDHCTARGVKLTESIIKRYAKGIGEARKQDFTPALIKTALAQMLDDNEAARPSLLDNYLVRAQTGPAKGPRRMTRTEASMTNGGSPVAALIRDALTRPA